MAFSIPTTMRRLLQNTPFHLALAVLDHRFQQSVSTELWPFQKLPVTRTFLSPDLQINLSQLISFEKCNTETGAPDRNATLEEPKDQALIVC